MDTFKAMARGMLARGHKRMVFDWEKAARLIAERNPREASAGLAEDWEYTGGVIWADGGPCLESYTYLASTWATPELEIDGEVIACFRMEDEVPGWGGETKWPPEACAIAEAAK
jgi:hypothetical protein